MTEKGRLPPNQRLIKDDFPFLGNVGEPSTFEREKWTLYIYGLVEKEITLSWKEFTELPITKINTDFHCVTGWTVYDQSWLGVSSREIFKISKPLKSVKNVTIECEKDYTTSLSLDEFLDNDVLFAYKLNGEFLEPERGAPVRLVVPKKYGWKSAKWVRKVKFTVDKELGYWEIRGYHDNADPWKEERYW